MTIVEVVDVPLWITTDISLGPFHEFEAWNARADSSIWVKIFGDFIISRQARPLILGKKKNA